MAFVERAKSAGFEPGRTDTFIADAGWVGGEVTDGVRLLVVATGSVLVTLREGPGPHVTAGQAVHWNAGEWYGWRSVGEPPVTVFEFEPSPPLSAVMADDWNFD